MDDGQTFPLFEAPLRLQVQAVAPGKELGWGAGVLATAGRAGWGLGPAASPPPLNLGPLSLELLFGGTAGPGGEWAAAVLGLVRW
jgi:hypothetical protein